MWRPLGFSERCLLHTVSGVEVADIMQLHKSQLAGAGQAEEGFDRRIGVRIATSRACAYLLGVQLPSITSWSLTDTLHWRYPDGLTD